MYRWLRALCFVTAAVVGAVMLFTVPLLAQQNLLSGGPLWWLPDNNEDWPRHHDRWLISPVEVAAEGAATSFPERVWEPSRARGYMLNAPPNSACDFMNGVEIMNVGPPDPDRRRDDAFAMYTTRRTPTGDFSWRGRCRWRFSAVDARG